MTEAELIEGLTAGVVRTRSFIAELTDYHGGPAETEYLITTDIAREFLHRNREVRVEALNYGFCTSLAAADPKAAKEVLGLQRTDVAVGARLAPDALIEVKIRITALGGIAGDLKKLIDTVRWMRPVRQRRLLAASVFQMHTAATKRRWKQADFAAAVAKTESALHRDLARYGLDHPDFTFDLKSLQSNPADGIVDFSLDESEDGFISYGQPGHATCYYAVVIKHRDYGRPAVRTFAQLKAEATGMSVVPGPQQDDAAGG